MFRNPRQPPVDQAPQDFNIRPSIGRPPTPPSSTSKKVRDPLTKQSITMPTPTTPVLGRSKTVMKSSVRSSAFSGGKTRPKPNGSILNFFKKAPYTSTPDNQNLDLDESLFIEDHELPKAQEVLQIPTPPMDHISVESSPKSSGKSEDEDVLRFNEEPGAVKRQRVEGPSIPSSSSTSQNAKPIMRTGPFFEDSDDDDETITKFGKRYPEYISKPQTTPLIESHEKPNLEDTVTQSKVICSPPMPSLKHEPTSIEGDNGFDNMEDFIDDEFPEEGEEYLERKWMEEHDGVESDFEDAGLEGSLDTKLQDVEKEMVPVVQEALTPACPICSTSFDGLTDQGVLIHVNDCLDREPALPPTLPAPPESKPQDSSVGGITSVPPQRRFQRAAIAKPGQENPFGLTLSLTKGSSAFSTMMSTHAEDTAWATAAAAEVASRGKPAYQRTCPFYKILPGFFICVDAFRYGAVEGCKAYFLSHFHSDHYIGLTSSWCHGPIYCSHVTANLVRQQLRVDPKWVVDLAFDDKTEVPETGGVEVTMIPANHCPGSSLYLFEKVVGKGKTPKVQRVLHCGDFRACPAQVQHPRLRPDIVDAITGRNIAQQKLDVCYLDTTYLTPKYAFPSQEEVIQACADMCVSLGKERIDINDSWEKTKRERAGNGMVRFVRRNSDTVAGKEEDDGDAVRSGSTREDKARGRLLVIVGTYSIGKERICLGIARALDSKIYAPPHKQRICAALEDPELTARLTNDPLEAQVHMQMLMEIRAETLADYLTTFKPHFSRIVGFRPSGWNYRPPHSRFVESPAVQTVLHSDNWKSRYTMAELVPQRGSTREAQCFGVPYSEHSSFRELTMFCCALRIDKIIPTVNVGSAKSREKMKGWCEKWALDKKKHGLFPVADGQVAW